MPTARSRSSRRSTTSKKNACCSSVAGGTELAKCLLWDHWSQGGASHDADPCGTYRTEHDGSVIFEQARIVCPRYVPCKTSLDVDKLVARVLLAAAKHAHRRLVLDERMLKGTLWRLPEGRVWAAPSVMIAAKEAGRALSGKEDIPLAESAALPRGVVVHVAGFPEEFGRLCYDCSGFGVSVIAVHQLSVFEVVPSVTMERNPAVVG